MQASLLNSSWLKYDPATHFPLENIPFGVIKTAAGVNHCCTRVGDNVVDLAVLFPLFKGPLFATLSENVFEQETLNKFAALGKTFRLEARETIQALFADAVNEATVSAALVPFVSANM